LINDPIEWQVDKHAYQINAADDKYVDVIPNKRDILYRYKVSYMVDKREHVNYVLFEFMRLMPRRFCLVIEKDGETETLPFSRIYILNLDQTLDDKHVYRKDFLLQTHLLLQLDEIETHLRPYSGTELTVGTGKEAIEELKP
jgi:hypothetical protein